jgi:outer membrane protein assembly factor BamE (lipoprotein component of BamABCDE complex)
MKRDRHILIALLVVCCGCCSGCLIIPTPEFDADQLQTRRNVSADDARAIADGATTREHVLLSFGEPDAALFGERRFVYAWAKVAALWFAAAGYSADAGGVPKGYVLEIDFDNRGVVRTHVVRTAGLADLFSHRVLNGVPYARDKGAPPADE